MRFSTPETTTTKTPEPLSFADKSCRSQTNKKTKPPSSRVVCCFVYLRAQLNAQREIKSSLRSCLRRWAKNICRWGGHHPSAAARGPLLDRRSRTSRHRFSRFVGKDGPADATPAARELEWPRCLCVPPLERNSAISAVRGPWRRGLQSERIKFTKRSSTH